MRIGAMLETPAALLEAGPIARECEFAAFGTSDLTQLCLGLSREDYPAILAGHLEHDLLRADPFTRLHPSVYRMIREAAAAARDQQPGVVLGLCGRHARDPQALDLVLDGLVDHLSVAVGELDAVALEALQRAWSRTA